MATQEDALPFNALTQEYSSRFNRLARKNPSISIRKNFNILARGLPDEFNVAAIQLQTDISLAELREHKEELQETQTGYFEDSINLYHEVTENYAELIEVLYKVTNYYKQAYANKEIDQKTYNQYVRAIKNYHDAVVMPNYDQLKKEQLPAYQAYLNDLPHRVELCYDHYKDACAHKNSVQQQSCYFEDSKEIYTTAIKTHDKLLTCLEQLRNFITSSSNPNKETLDDIDTYYEEILDNSDQLTAYLNDYQKYQDQQAKKGGITFFSGSKSESENTNPNLPTQQMIKRS